MNHRFPYKDYLLLLAFAFLVVASWTGNVRTIASRAGIWKQDDLELTQLLGRKRLFYKPTFDRFLSGEFQETLEVSIRDSFPFLQEILQGSSNRKRASGAVWLGALPTDWSPVGPAGLDGVMITSDHQRLIGRPLMFSDRTESMEKKAEYFTQLAARHPDVSVSVFAVQWPEQTFASCSVWPEATRQILAGDRHMKQFGELLDGSVSFSWAGRGVPPEETLKNHYSTDHHLTIAGAYEVYQQLFSLFESGGKTLGVPVEMNDQERVGSFLFFGSYARRAGGSTVIGDPIYDADFSLPDLRVTAHQERSQVPRNKRDAYRSGSISSGRFAKHYSAYFGGNLGQVEYESDEHFNPGTLLVVSDSLDNSLEPLLASHFRRTLFIEERDYATAMGKPFDLDGVISENDVTDVLFLGTGRVFCGVTETYD